MNRWLLCAAPLVVFSVAMVAGCSENKDAGGGTSTTTTTSGGETGTTGSGSTAGTSETAGSATAGDTAGKAGTTPADAPVAEKPADGDEVVVLDTSMGKVTLMFYPSKAPRTVENFINLSKAGFYNGTRFHRCMPGFMIQGGDPNSKDLAKEQMWGTGGNMDKNGQEIRLPGEVNGIHHDRGVISMANSGSPDTASSQFFIVQTESGFLDRGYTAFGKVVDGLDVVDKIVATGPQDQTLNGKVDPKKAVVLKSATVKKWPIK